LIVVAIKEATLNFLFITVFSSFDNLNCKDPEDEPVPMRGRTMHPPLNCRPFDEFSPYQFSFDPDRDKLNMQPYLERVIDPDIHSHGVE
jgi:hypothetical protein